MATQVESIKENLNNQLSQSLLRCYEIKLQLDALNKAHVEEEAKVKMIRDTLQGILITEQANQQAAAPQAPGPEAPQAPTEA